MLNHTPNSPFSTIPTSPFIVGTPYEQRTQPSYTDTSVGKVEGTKMWSRRRAIKAYRAEQAALRTIAKLELLAE